MARGEDPIEKIAQDAVDPGEPGPRSGFTVPQAADPGEPPENVPSEGTDAGAEEEGGGGESLELPEGTVLLYDEEGQAFLGIPIDPADIPDEGGEE